MSGLKIIVLGQTGSRYQECWKRCHESRWNSKPGCIAGIFNPEDLNALEQALRIKDRYPDTEDH
jgi:electron transfer flavoprotein beta subunit